MTSNILRSLQICMTVLIAFSGTVLAAAEWGPIASLTIPISLGTLLLIDLPGVRGLPLWIATLGGVAAFIGAGYEFFTGGIEARILSGGHLLVYLTWVFLLQAKGEREFWWLTLLATLQIAVASVLTDAPWFGMSLFLFCIIFCGTLSISLVHRSTTAALSGAAVIERSRDLIRATNGGTGPRGRARAGVSMDLSERFTGARLLGSTLALTCMSITLASAIFLLIPRVWRVNIKLFGDLEIGSGRALTGFTDEVRLGDLGEILESNELAMEIDVLDRNTGQSLRYDKALAILGEEPLFRGSALEEYQSGHWIRLEFREESTNIPREPERGSDILRVKLKPVGMRTLFSFGNTTTVIPRDGSLARSEFLSNEFFRSVRDRDRLNEDFDYDICVLPGRDDEYNMLQRSMWPNHLQGYYLNYLNRLSGLPEELERVKRIAQEQTSGLGSPNEKANRLQAYLRDNAEFRYSLSQEVLDSSVDPILDFLENRKSGHCEYYASAMALLLRGVRIPSRVISGFKGSVYDMQRRVFQVQQLHAHTWVEAFIEGRWQVFDPTPPERDAAVEQLQSSSSASQDWSSRFKNVWSMGARLSQSQQQEMIYTPIRETALKTWEFTRGLVTGNGQSLRQILGFLSDPRRWFSVQGGLAAFVLLTLMSGTIWLGLRLRMLFRIYRIGERDAGIAAIRVPFFERFRSILEKQGLRQGESQTAREYAAVATERINEALAASGLTAFPPELIRRFYDIRFGGKPLSSADVENIDKRLSALELQLREQLTGKTRPNSAS